MEPSPAFPDDPNWFNISFSITKFRRLATSNTNCYLAMVWICWLV
jgi:hypothetical protein